MLQADPTLLQNQPEADPDLQKLFQVVPPSNQKEADTIETVPESKPGNQSSKSTLETPVAILSQLFFPTEAVAAQPTFKEILQWKVPRSDVGEYVSKVNALLEKSAQEIWKDSDLPDSRDKMFGQLIKALAWQESCFRQFTVRDTQFTYLLSYNQSSVGLMQVNERVWRGIYNRESLRWDINYNADAGGQIAALYLGKYALREKSVGSKMDDATLARLVYALYNGGPSQYKKFLKRLKTKTTYRSDDLFWEKYQWLSNGELVKASICLVGS